jgi:tRNA A-37 threonylcarbamoyl transferase component Bud32
MRSCPHCLSPYAADVEFCGIDGTRIVVSDVDPLIGQEIDRYRIVERIGDGAMARVYRATHKVLDLEYAVKVLLGEIASDKKLSERFRREAQVISKLSHPNIVAVVDFGSTKHGLTFLTMELLRGRTLRDAIKKDGAFSVERAAHITRQIASGLSDAHAHGFVHRDLKPGNVMLLEDNGSERAKILDFGLVRAPETEEEGLLTKTGQFLGTPIYMAPEQIIGADVTLHADLYALGVVLFEMLEGKPPFRAKSLAEIRRKHLSEAPPAMRSSRGLEDIALALLHKDPLARPQSAAEVISRIDFAIDPGLGPPDITVKTELPFIEEKTRRVPVLEELTEAVPAVADAYAAAAAEEEAAADEIVDELPIVPALAKAPTPAAVVPMKLEHSLAPRLVSSFAAVDAVAENELGSMIEAIGKRRWIMPAGIAAVMLGLTSAIVFALSRDSAVVQVPVHEAASVEPPAAQLQLVKAEPTKPPVEPQLVKTEPAKEPPPRPVKLEPAPAHPQHAKPEPTKAEEPSTVRVKAPPKRKQAPAEPQVTHAALQRRLDQLSAKLSQASSKLKEAELRPLEDRYLALAEALNPHATESELNELMKKANALARDLSRAIEH